MTASSRVYAMLKELAEITGLQAKFVPEEALSIGCIVRA
jgi:hypothetical protein